MIRGEIMKKLLFLTAAVCMLAAAAFAQDKKGADFSGKWTLDVAKSKLDERMRVESMTMTVAQTPAELSVTTETKRPAPPADAPVRSGGGGRGGFGGDGKAVYSLEGKETKLELDGPNGKIPQALKAKAEGNKLNLSKSMTMSTPGGDVTISTKEIWELGADGKSLTVNRESTSPRGTSTSTLVFTKS
jgi:hypothetical protein